MLKLPKTLQKTLQIAQNWWPGKLLVSLISLQLFVGKTLNSSPLSIRVTRLQITFKLLANIPDHQQ